jgi:hypothetical protein
MNLKKYSITKKNLKYKIAIKGSLKKKTDNFGPNGWIEKKN